MPRVVPSQVVAFLSNILIDDAIINLTRYGTSRFTAALDLLAQIPSELITLSPTDFTRLTNAKSILQDQLATWRANQHAGHPLDGISVERARDPIRVIRDRLALCPDESPAPGTSELTFITDVDLRDNLRNDIGAISRALSNGEWKATTVLAGSAIRGPATLVPHTGPASPNQCSHRDPSDRGDVNASAKRESRKMGPPRVHRSGSTPRENRA